MSGFARRENAIQCCCKFSHYYSSSQIIIEKILFCINFEALVHSAGGVFETQVNSVRKWASFTRSCLYARLFRQICNSIVFIIFVLSCNLSPKMMSCKFWSHNTLLILWHKINIVRCQIFEALRMTARTVKTLPKNFHNINNDWAAVL